MNSNKRFYVHIYRDVATNNLGFYFVERMPNGKLAVALPMKLDFGIQEPNKWMGALTPPSLLIPYDIAEPFMQAMAETLSNNGIKTDKDAKIEGTMEATRYHLEDLRQLLQLTKQGENP